MLEKNKTLETMLGGGVVAVVRAQSTDGLLQVIKAIEEGGIRAIEITMTTPGALEMISTIAREYSGEVLVGAGTVLDAETARAVILAGARFVVAPNLNLDVIRMAKRYDRIVVPGALTPTEILAAWEAGADLVKIFPASSLGPQYIKDLLGPLPQIAMIPTGGVTLENAGQYIKAGAKAIATGSNLVNPKWLKEGKLHEITKMAAAFVSAVHEARSGN